MPYLPPVPRLILASASPRRQELLRQAGVAFTTVSSQIDEGQHPGERPEGYVRRVAGEKAREVADRYPGYWVLAADTIVEIDGEILGKPHARETAKRMLRQLSNRYHRVLTAFDLLDPEGRLFADRMITSQVLFKPLADAQIDAYLATGEPFDKAGSYAVQGQGAALVATVTGSYTNVVGLPMDEVLDVLHKAGLMNAGAPHA